MGFLYEGCILYGSACDNNVLSSGTASANATSPPPGPPTPPPAPPPPPGAHSQLWLDYRPVRGASRYGGAAGFTQLYCGNTTADGILGNACAELLVGLAGMLGQHPTLVDKVSADSALVLRAGNGAIRPGRDLSLHAVPDCRWLPFFT